MCSKPISADREVRVPLFPVWKLPSPFWSLETTSGIPWMPDLPVLESRSKPHLLSEPDFPLLDIAEMFKIARKRSAERLIFHPYAQ